MVSSVSVIFRGTTKDELEGGITRIASTISSSDLFSPVAICSSFIVSSVVVSDIVLDTGQ